MTQRLSPDAAQPTDLGGQVRKAVFWRTGTQILSQSISWIATFIVLNLLNPADYGLYAMAAVMMTFLDFLNGYGFASSLIHKKEISSHMLRQALGITIVMNSGIAALQFAIAPAVAAYYGKPEVADLLHLLAFVYLATPFIIVPEALLSRGLDFKKQAIVNLSAAMVGAAVSLSCALLGFGVWTLVYAPMALCATRAIGLTIAARLFVLPSFDFREAGAIFKFGLALMAGHLFWVIQSQSDIFIAGRRFDEHDVGLYAEALFLTQLVMAKFVPAINQVAFPAYARLQDQPEALRWNFLAAVRVIMLVTAPIFIGISVSAGPFVDAVLQPQWAGLTPFMQILGLAMPLMTLQILFAPMNNGMGRPDISMRASACGALCFGTAFLVGSHYGAIGLAYAWLFAAPLLLLATIMLSGRLTGIGLADVFGASAPAILCALAMGGAVMAADMLLPSHLLPWLHLLLLVLFGALSYIALSWQFQRDTIRKVVGLIRGK